MDQGKVKAVREWPTPQSVKELQKILEFANFYRRFIKDFSLLTDPLTTLLRGKPKSLSWNPSAHEAFETLKTAVSTGLILRHPNPQVLFMVETDASTVGVGAVLSQQFGEPPSLCLQPCAFLSRKLTPAEQNYDIRNRELLAIKLALECWRELTTLSRPSLTTRISNTSVKPRGSTLDRLAGLYSLPGLNSPLPTDQAAATSRLTLSRVSTHLILQWILSRFSLQPSLLTPSFWNIYMDIQAATLFEPAPLGGPEGKLFVMPSQRQALLGLVHKVPGSGHPGSQRTLSLLMPGFGGPVCPLMSSGTSVVVQSVSCRLLHAICWWARSYHSQFHDGPGLIWKLTL